MGDIYIIVDKIKWWIPKSNNGLRYPQPFCPKHNLRLRPSLSNGTVMDDNYLSSNYIKCEDCNNPYLIPRSLIKEKEYVIDKVDSKIIRNIRFINLDDEALPIAKAEIDTLNTKYFVTGLLTESKVGLRLIIYAGEKGKKEKSQIFVEPEIKRLAFDQNNLHPTDIFTKVEAIFDDKTTFSITKIKK